MTKKKYQPEISKPTVRMLNEPEAEETERELHWDITIELLKANA